MELRLTQGILPTPGDRVADQTQNIFQRQRTGSKRFIRTTIQELYKACCSHSTGRPIFCLTTAYLSGKGRTMINKYTNQAGNQHSLADFLFG